jgi:hypothetical protein
MTNYTRGLLLAQKFSMEDQMGKKQKLICTLIAAFLVVVVNGGVSADVLLIQVDSPTSGSVWNPGNTYGIHWYTKDTSGGGQIPQVWVKLLLFPQGQLNKATTIAEFPISNESTYINWKVPPNTVPGSYVIRVQLSDTIAYPNKYGESAPFTIGPPAPAAVKVVLPGDPGWVPTINLPPITGEAPQSGSGTETKGSVAIKNFPGPSGATATPVPTTPDLAGQWKSSIGLVYDITQKRDHFGWTVSKTNEKGEGILKGTTLSASWQGPQGSGSSQGQVTAIDATGRATQIDWKNGVRFYRSEVKDTPTKQEVTPIQLPKAR